MNDIPTWAYVLFTLGGIVLLAGFWVWTTRQNNKKGK